MKGTVYSQNAGSRHVEWPLLPWKTIVCVTKYIPHTFVTRKADCSVRLKIKRKKVNAANICFSSSFCSLEIVCSHLLQIQIS